MSLFIVSPLESILDRLSSSHGLHNDRTGVKSLHVTKEMGDTGEFRSLYLDAVDK